MENSNNVADLLREHASNQPNASAILWPSGTMGGRLHWETLTFQQLDQMTDRFARGFAEKGIARGDRALLLLKPGLDFFPVVFALMRIGAVPVFIDPGMGAKPAIRCVEQIKARVLVAISPVHAVRQFYRGPFKSVKIPITVGKRWFWMGPTLESCRSGDLTPMVTAPFTLDEEAAIVFTSGSTGPAKGVSLSHGCMRARVGLIKEMLGLKTGQTIVETLLVYTLLEICMGLSVVVPHIDVAKPGKADPQAIVDAIREHNPPLASASPVVWQRLVRHCIDNDIRLPSVRLMLTTAAPIPVDLHERLKQVVSPQTELFTPYGATEAMPVAFIGTRTILDETAVKTAAGAGTCVGTLAPGIDARIISTTDDPIETWSDDLCLGVDEIGEIVVMGDGVSDTYRESADGNERAKIKDGDRIRHRMGDLGYLDVSGKLWFCGRKSHRVETRSGTIPVVAVEGVYNQHPAVFRTALVGVGPAGRQIPVLCVELEAGQSWSDTLGHELDKLSEGTRWAGLVTRYLPHSGFPTDTRHNSKIKREILRPWAEDNCRDLMT